MNITCEKKERTVLHAALRAGSHGLLKISEELIHSTVFRQGKKTNDGFPLPVSCRIQRDGK